MRSLSSLKRLAVVSFGVLSACTLRPYYQQLLPPDVHPSASAEAPARDVTLRLIEPETGRPIPGGRIFFSTYRGRIGVTSDEQGFVQVPVNQDLMDQNPLVEVVLPPGTTGYRFQPVKAEPPPPPPPVAPPPPPSEPGPSAPPPPVTPPPPATPPPPPPPPHG